MDSIPPEEYQKAWAEIDSLEQKGLPKSALEKVNELFNLAKTDTNGPQEVKCLIYKFKYEQQLNENGFSSGLKMLEEKIDSLDFPAQPLMQSYLASFYQSYLDGNLWKIRDRTEISGKVNEDIETWTYEEFVKKITDLYFKSLNHDNLSSIKLASIQPLLSNYNKKDNRRTTLFDLLAFEALDYFKNDRFSLDQPSYAFQIEDEVAFADAEIFARHQFETRDSSSNKWYSILLFQRTLQEQINRSNKAALLDANLDRLSFVKNNSISPNKDELFNKAILRLNKKYEGDPLQSQLSYELAQIAQQEGQKFESQPYWQEVSPEQKALKDKLLEAANICTEAMDRYPGSMGAKKCQSLLSRLKSKSLGLETEAIFTSTNNILAKISYQNIDKAFARLVKLTEKELETFNDTRWTERMSFINKLPEVTSLEISLPNAQDLRNHSLEFSLPSQNYGQYILQVSDNKNFEEDGGAVSFALFQISDMALIKLNEYNQSESNYAVLNREKGTPIKGVDATFFTNEYSQLTRKNILKRIGKTQTNEDGMFSFVPERTNYFKIRLENGDDIQFPSDNFYTYRNYPDQSYHSIFFFLDRKIYRPGQTVHFKAVVLQFDANQIPTIVPNEKIDFSLYDANNQVIETVQLQTNEFGTCSASFNTPGTGLLGNMRIQGSGNLFNQHRSSISFRVEEYKRPKFEVTLEEYKEEIALGDQVKIKGQAMAYAGYPIDGGQITYRIVRNIRYLYWPWWRWGGPAFSSPETTIKNGTGETKEDGTFEFTFEALPDPTIDKETKPEFNYTIYVDVTDENGETHSNQSSIKLAYTSLYLDILTDQNIELDQWNALELQSSNIQGKDLSAEVNIKIEQLKHPDRPVIKRYWEYPDQIGMEESEFKKLFPYLSFNGQEDIQNWPVEKMVWEKTVSVSGKTSIPISSTARSQGNYLVTISAKDKSGLNIEQKKIIEVNDVKNSQPVGPDFLSISNLDESYEPGATGILHMKTSENNIPVLIKETRVVDKKSPYWKNMVTNSSITIPVSENDRGNINFQFSYVQQNRFFNHQRKVTVPWSNKDLEVSFSTFRDKLEPGSKETWSIKVSGQKKDQVAAEMLVSMYDASLDAFAANSWTFSPFPTVGIRAWPSAIGFQVQHGQLLSRNWQTFYNVSDPAYPFLNFKYIGNQYGRGDALMMDMAVGSVEKRSNMRNEAMEADVAEMEPPRTAEPAPTIEEVPDEEIQETDDVPIRTNLKETVFFYPDLKTDKDGNVIFSFTMNEALTKWKFMGLAQTKKLASGIITQEVVTQKDLMVVPNPPRFFREGDEILYSAKVVNLSDKDLEGTVRLELLDAISGEPVNKQLANIDLEQPFQIKAGSSESFKWPLQIPLKDVQAVTHRVIAKAGNFSDGEESALPVLTNRMLVTESLPLPLRGESKGTFVLQNLRDNTSNTLTHQRMTLEFTQNPAWYAVKSLPYLMEYPYECTEQIFSRYYANSLASHVANAHPKVKRVFDAWKNYQPEALESQLTKNQELKSALLEETPWVLQAQSEAAQRKNIGLLFDLNRMGNEKQNALRKLAERQEGNGGWSWFPGGRPSWYITQYLVEGMGRLEHLGVTTDQDSEGMIRKAIGFIDFSLNEHYKELLEMVKKGNTSLENDHLDNMVIHYLHARSYFIREGNWKQTKTGEGTHPFNQEHIPAIAYYLGQAKKYALDKGDYQQGMLALSLQRWEAENEVPAQIVRSLKERSLNNPEMGMYWKYPRGWWWYQAPIETHALMIEVFEEVAKDPKAVDDLKVWLLKNKQTTHWKTTKATANAVYALLMNGDNWLLEDKPVSFEWAGEKFKSSDFDQEAGTGYFKTSWSGDYLEQKEKDAGRSSVATIKVENPNKNVAWGAMYWQYFEQLDKITTFEETPLTLKKDIFKVVNTDTGEKLQSLEKENGIYSKIKIGDKLKIRIELRVDRDMEYVHLKDMRAAGLEPIQVLSQYKWQDGLGYYESPGDVATNFFFSYLPKGTYVFEYPLRVQHAGDFSNGISNIQCMYAPEFTSHSAGVRLKID
ncbi:MAG: alpha-2-macroglobulin [Saprospiraceae bacterium]|nr:alpha-2-macroglobulin [Saprospiraceae bacterium]